MSTGRRNQRTIFLIEEDDETRVPLKQNLQKDGYRVIVALDEEDALERVGGQLQADLILINLVGKPPGEALNVGRRIREHAKYDGQTPLIVMAEKYGQDLEGRDVNAGGNDWIAYLADAHQLRHLIDRLLEKV